MTVLRSPRGNVYGPDEYNVLNKPRVSVTRSTAQTLAAATAVPLSWPTLNFDTDGLWSTADDTRLSCKTAGIYLATVSCAFSYVAGGYCQLFFQKNGGGKAYGDVVLPKGVAAVGTYLSTAWPIPMNRDDYLIAYAVHSAGGTMLASTDNEFTATLISAT